ncbi:hypothetical protein GCM10010174_15390 [Kutzneria viridogrisea]|uniref:PASTA domain-containing protein n=2 Tax=Kutzneria TaxID=43356 RepID=W5WJB5_9PSEU|nr:PASTA domain-containing protein [Kutzneria albida]AHI00836.1 hypothetical protein KALB_7478 [Kutzneria albida DSM 43870]MBA8926113.1 hypothetical protein [Kutzneria viridogrisea]
MSRSRFIAAALVIALPLALGAACKPLDTQQPGGQPGGTSAQPAAKVAVPDVKGKNADIAQTTLRNLGLKNVKLESVDPNAKVVIAPVNWTVAGVEPAVGSSISTEDAVVLKVTKSGAVTTPGQAPAKVTLPDVNRQNAEVSMDKLHKLGLKNVSFGSVDPSAKVVLAPANWTVVGMEPAAGSSVAVNDAVVLKVTKHP